MKIILVAGGSGGHIYPALELAKYLKEKGISVLLAGSKNSMEEVIYKESGLEFVTLNITKKKTRSFLSNYKAIKKIYKEYQPDKLILFGNYISVSFAIVAILEGIPIYLHEQNVVYGKANKLLGGLSKRIYLSLPLDKDMYKKKSMLVGNPKGDSVILNESNLSRDKKNVFIVMGSLGSESINDFLLEFISKCNPQVNYHIVTGKKHFKEFNGRCDKKSNVLIYPYLNNLIEYTSKCDLFVSRSGATTISEIINYKIPSILIPSPYVSNNHQYKNAKFLLDRKACELIEEKNLTANLLNEKILDLLNNELKIQNIKRNLETININNSKEKIYRDIKNEK